MDDIMDRRVWSAIGHGLKDILCAPTSEAASARRRDALRDVEYTLSYFICSPEDRREELWREASRALGLAVTTREVELQKELDNDRRHPR